MHHFADDTNLLNINRNVKTLIRNTNKDLKSLWLWLNANKIALNTSKTEYIVFGHSSKSLPDPPKLKIGGKRIHQSKTIKYLGVLIDSDLSWKSQINSIGIKLKQMNGIIAKLR